MKIWSVKYICPLASSVGGDSIVDSLFIVVATIVCAGFVFDPCFVMQYRGGSRISGSGVHTYKGVGESVC